MRRLRPDEIADYASFANTSRFSQEKRLRDEFAKNFKIDSDNPGPQRTGSMTPFASQPLCLAPFLNQRLNIFVTCLKKLKLELFFPNTFLSKKIAQAKN